MEIQRMENPWSEEELDDEDLLHIIAQKYTVEEFSKLSFEEILDCFEGAGTSSEKLFDIILKKGKEDYLSKNPQTRDFFEELENQLDTRAKSIQVSGVQEKTIQGKFPFKKHTVSFPSLKELQEQYHDEETGAAFFARNLGKILLVEMLDLICQMNPGNEEQERSFLEKILKVLYGNDRQFGQSGRRGSVVNECVLAAKSKYEEPNSDAKKVIALLEVLREVCKKTTNREEFWFYLADSKSLSSYLPLFC